MQHANLTCFGVLFPMDHPSSCIVAITTRSTTSQAPSTIHTSRSPDGTHSTIGAAPGPRMAPIVPHTYIVLGPRQFRTPHAGRLLRSTTRRPQSQSCRVSVSRVSGQRDGSGRNLTCPYRDAPPRPSATERMEQTTHYTPPPPPPGRSLVEAALCVLSRSCRSPRTGNRNA